MKNFKVALQLFSIKDEMAKGMDAALRKVKEIGYDYVEFAGFMGETAESVRGMLDRNGLECVSVHLLPDILIKGDDGQTVRNIKTLGAEYCAIPHYSVSLLRNPEWKETAAYFLRLGAMLKENDIQLLYHNHDFEFEKDDSEVILDRILKELPKELMQPEIDTCWVHYAGQNPAEYIMRHCGRSDIVHLKDFTCTKLSGEPIYSLIGSAEERPAGESVGFEFRPLGLGIQDFPEILKACEEAETEILVVEQDVSLERNSMEAAKISREYLRALGV